MIDSRRVAALLFAVGVAPLASADVSWRYTAQGNGCEEFASMRVAVHGSRVRFDAVQQGQRNGMLFDGGEEIMYGLDHERRTFMEMAVDADTVEYTGDVMHAAGARLDQAGAQRAEMQAGMPAVAPGQQAQMQELYANAQKQMESQGERMDPEMRKMYEQAMAQMQNYDATNPRESMRRMADAMRETVQRTGGTATVAGMTCALRERRLQDELVATECVVEPTALDLDARDQAGIALLFRSMKRLGNSADQFMGDRSDAQRKRDEDTDLVLQRTCYVGGKAAGTATIVIDRNKADPALFEIPAGYTPMNMGADPAAAMDRTGR